MMSAEPGASNTSIHIRMYIHVCMYVYIIYIFIYIHVYYIYIHIYVHIPIHILPVLTFIYIYIHTYVCVYPGNSGPFLKQPLDSSPKAILGKPPLHGTPQFLSEATVSGTLFGSKRNICTYSNLAAP